MQQCIRHLGRDCRNEWSVAQATSVVMMTMCAHRRIAAAEAKCSLLNAYRTARTSNEPAKLARQAERATITAAKEKRRLDHERVKRDETERQGTELIAVEPRASRPPGISAVRQDR